MKPGFRSTPHDGRGHTPRLCWLLGFLLLGHAVWITTDARAHAGAEHYGAWAGAQARAAGTAANPYADGSAFAAAMNARDDAVWRELGAADQALAALDRAGAAGGERDPAGSLLQRLAPRLDPRQQELARAAQGWLRANAQHRHAEVTAPPLRCAAYALLPADWDGATAVCAALACAALLLGATLLWCAAGGALAEGVLLAVALMVAAPSYARDVGNGGGGCLALLLAALAVAIARRGTGAPAALLLAPVVLLLLEPRAAALALALAAPGALRHAGALRRAFAVGLLALALLLWPCLWFGSAAVWLDWLAASARRSSLSDWIVPAVVFGSAAFVARAARGSLRQLLADPLAAAALGAVAAASAGPAVPRGALLAVVALPWLLLRREGGAAKIALTALAAALYAELAGAVVPLLQLDEAPAAPPAFLAPLGACAWVPLWLAVLWQIARPERAPVPVT
jgi:hypothetical protein